MDRQLAACLHKHWRTIRKALHKLLFEGYPQGSERSAAFVRPQLETFKVPILEILRGFEKGEGPVSQSTLHRVHR